MSEATKNLKLELPFQTDFYNVEVFNANATKIDNAVGQAAQEATLATVKADVAAVKADVAAATERIGSSADVISDTPTTLFGAVKRLLSWFADTWTVARAGKIDTISTDVMGVKTDVAAVKTAVDTRADKATLEAIILMTYCGDKPKK